MTVCLRETDFYPQHVLAAVFPANVLGEAAFILKGGGNAMNDSGVRIPSPWKKILESIVREVAVPVLTRPKPGKRIQNARDAWNYAKDRPWVSDEREHFVLLCLDGKHRVKKEIEVSIGTLSASLVHPREVFRPAIEHSAAGVVVLHNHPSGDPTPSAEDIQVTRRLHEAGRLIGIPLLDHVIIGPDGFKSLSDLLGSA